MPVSSFEYEANNNDNNSELIKLYSSPQQLIMSSEVRFALIISLKKICLKSHDQEEETQAKYLIVY